MPYPLQEYELNEMPKSLNLVGYEAEAPIFEQVVPSVVLIVRFVPELTWVK